MSSALVLEKFLAGLWVQYKKRVPYASRYQDMVESLGGQLHNDHIAFRTFMAPTGAQPSGVEALARIFNALGYKQKERYVFSDKKLTAWHWEHTTNISNPKIFISQLEVDQLSKASAQSIKDACANTPDHLTADDLNVLATLADNQSLPLERAIRLAETLVQFCSRPWTPPLRRMVETLNLESQYAAWTLLHGNSVNHFTAYINEQNVKTWPDLETTVLALRQAGLPMKDEFEGERGSKLRQSSTQAVMEQCDVLEDDGRIGKLEWSYAYYELAERGNISDSKGNPTRFQGFLGAQATNLFEMTKRS